MEFNDRSLKCVNCGEDFVFSAGEQLFFREKQFQNEPKRCAKCKAKRDHRPQRVETTVTCSECGASTTVPFKPHKGGQPVLCRGCFQANKSRQNQSSSEANLVNGFIDIYQLNTAVAGGLWPEH